MSARRDALFALALWKVRGAFPAATLRDAADHAFALELAGTALRHRASLEWAIRQCVKRLPDGELWAALLIGAAQLLCMPGVADHAAVSETVEAAKPAGRGAARFVNAVLRRIQRERDALLAGLERQSPWIRHNLPEALWTRWARRWGEAETLALAEAIANPPRTCVRPLSPFGAPADCPPHPDDPGGTFVVPHGRRVESLDGFAEGRFVAQDAATRHAVELMEVRPGQHVLDLCAAPGGKTAQLAACLQGQGRLVANELSPARAATLRDTLARCRLDGFVAVTERDAAKPELWRDERERFDAVLLDAPCSNTGVLGRRPDARWTWTARKMRQLCATQAALLDAAAGCVVPGGRLVYSTCSIENEEDEDQIAAFLARHPDFTLETSRLERPAPLHDGAYAALLRRH